MLCFVFADGIGFKAVFPQSHTGGSYGTSDAIFATPLSLVTLVTQSKVTATNPMMPATHLQCCESNFVAFSASLCISFVGARSILRVASVCSCGKLYGSICDIWGRIEGVIPNFR